MSSATIICIFITPWEKEHLFKFSFKVTSEFRDMRPVNPWKTEYLFFLIKKYLIEDLHFFVQSNTALIVCLFGIFLVRIWNEYK